MTACLRVILAGSALLAMPGCATAALNAALRAAHPQPAWNGDVAVASEPAGAACRIGRGTSVLAEVPATPATVRLDRSHNVLEVRCRADGHLETMALLRPADDPAVFRMAPNGVIGATATIISVATARTMRYPGVVTVALAPAIFASDAARDAWFAGRREAILAERAAEMALAEERCRAQPETACDGALPVMRREQEEDLARLEAQRNEVRVTAQVAEVR